MFLIDKYIPKSFNELYFHKNIYNFLQKMSEDESIPHLIFSGVFGKKTMVKLFLEMLYGEEVTKTKQIKYIISGSGNNANEEYFTESPFHIEINPINLGSNEKLFIGIHGEGVCIILKSIFLFHFLPTFLPLLY